MHQSAVKEPSQRHDQKFAYDEYHISSGTNHVYSHIFEWNWKKNYFISILTRKGHTGVSHIPAVWP